MEELNRIHQLLRRAKYFYYEYVNEATGESVSIMSDYEFDIMEKEYDVLCDRFGIKQEYRVTNFVGWDFRIPMSLFSFYPKDQPTKKRSGSTKKVTK